MSHRVVLRRGVLIAVATLVGLLIAQVLPRGSIGAPDSLGTLMGRDLQPPWWEAVTSHTPSPDSASYIVPADLLFSSNSLDYRCRRPIGTEGARTSARRSHVHHYRRLHRQCRGS